MSFRFLCILAATLFLGEPTVTRTAPAQDKAVSSTKLVTKVDRLVGDLQNPDREARRRAWVTLQQFGPADAPAISRLLRAATKLDPTLATQVVNAIVRVGPRGVWHLARELDESPDPHIRELSAKTLGSMPQHAGLALTSLSRALYDDNKGVVRASLKSRSGHSPIQKPAVAREPGEFPPLRENYLDNGIYAAPIVANNVLFIANKTRLFAIQSPLKGDDEQ